MEIWSDFETYFCQLHRDGDVDNFILNLKKQESGTFLYSSRISQLLHYEQTHPSEKLQHFIFSRMLIYGLDILPAREYFERNYEVLKTTNFDKILTGIWEAESGITASIDFLLSRPEFNSFESTLYTGPYLNDPVHAYIYQKIYLLIQNYGDFKSYRLALLKREHKKDYELLQKTISRRIKQAEIIQEPLSQREESILTIILEVLNPRNR